MGDIIIPIFVCVVLPVSVVFIVFFYLNKMSANKMSLLSKAIESGVDIDPKALMEALETKKKKSSKTLKSTLINRLIWGIILLVCGISFLVMTGLGYCNCNMDSCLPGIVCLAVGIALIVAYFVGVRMMRPEIELETRLLSGDKDLHDKASADGHEEK